MYLSNYVQDQKKKKKKTWRCNLILKWSTNDFKYIFTKKINLKFTFDIFIIKLINKIELGLTLFTKCYTCKMSFNHCYKIAHITWINKIK
jgi:hypothetical protein